MSRLKIPIDQYTAEDVLKKFSEMAYAVNSKEIFEEAVFIMYGRAFAIKMDLSRRMLFHCELCNKDMNSVEALESHCRSGVHQKNKDKKDRETKGTPSWTGASHFHQDSLQYRLMMSSFKAVGLQMVEEYTKGKGISYYKCNLCGAHGKIDHMYYHIIGKKHTEKYIKSAYKLKSPVLTGKERDMLRERLAREEGVDGSVIRTIQGREYYPTKWEALGRAVPKQYIKEEPRSPSPSSPGPSFRRPSSTYTHKSGRRSPRPRSPCRSPTRSIRSPSRSRKSPLRSRRSPARSRRSPSKSRRSPSKSRRSSPRSRRSASRSRRSPSRSKRSPSRSKRSPSRYSRSPSRSKRSRSKSKDKSPLSHFRNLSPPSPPSIGPLRSITPAPMPPPLSVPLPVPAPPVQAKPPPKPAVEVKDKHTQQFDLEELMVQFNFLVKNFNNPDCEVKTPEDAKNCINLMFSIADALNSITKMEMEDFDCSHSERFCQKLKAQKWHLEKIMGQIKYRLMFGEDYQYH